MNGKQNTKPIVYIDGENFLHSATRVLQAAGLVTHRRDLKVFDFNKLIHGTEIGQDAIVKYYGAKPSFRVSEELANNLPNFKQKATGIKNNYRILKNSVLSQKIEFVASGRLKVRDTDECKNCGHSDVELQEKGVDVSIAVDMVIQSKKGRNLYLISSDSDLVPAIKEAKNRGSSVTYVGYSNYLTMSIVAVADKYIVMRDQEIIDAFQSLNDPQFQL